MRERGSLNTHKKCTTHRRLHVHRSGAPPLERRQYSHKRTSTDKCSDPLLLAHPTNPVPVCDLSFSVWSVSPLHAMKKEKKRDAADAKDNGNDNDCDNDWHNDYVNDYAALCGEVRERALLFYRLLLLFLLLLCVSFLSL